jgi:cupin fold WbuC family metalloprotein
MKTLEILDPKDSSLLHRVVFLSEFQETEELLRANFSAENSFLQVALIQIPQHHDFKPHVHLERERSFHNLRAQESWVIIKGEVQVDYFSESGDFLETHTLQEGDCSISFKGGHGYRTLSKEAVVYEFKNGPYEGVSVDKKFI